ncbi:MAG: hypothetical protein JO049_13340, partial [Hyphomicrobiales bacterium]|nr:hypothetical protein [Hyphomicrobiales bacterium]
MKLQSGDDCVDPTPTMSAIGSAVVSRDACRAERGLCVSAHQIGQADRATGAERGSVMTCKRVAAACVGAALSLAIASFGSAASAADTTTTPTWKPAEPAPAPPPLDIHGFFDVTFANDYITPRGLLVTNTGLTTQIVNGLTFSLYKDPNTWINSFSVTVGTFNDLWSKQNNTTVGSWNEFDWWVSADWTIAKYWKTGFTYITFLSPPGNFSQERNVEPYIRFDDGALTGWAFTFNPYVKLFYAISGSSTVVVGNTGKTYDVEIGLVPTLDLKKITGTPLTIAAPTWVTVGPTSYWNRGVTGCGLATITPCSLSNAGVFTTGLALKESLDWLVPTRWGNWYVKGGFQYYHIINDSLLLAQVVD